jgi:hypothetical protein
MTTPRSTYNKNNLRLVKSVDYWYDIIMGGFQTSILLILMGSLFLIKMDLTFWIYPYSFLCIGIVAYYQWHDDNLIIINTGLSKENNYDLVTNSLDCLNWHYDKKRTKIDLTLNKYILKFLDPTIIPESEHIYINFKYHSTTKTGRFPFFFGISTYLERRFKKTINELLLNQIA